jgi:uncharacterized protein (DUF2236 family)
MRHRGTMAWLIHREIVLLLGWGPAILLQLAHPLIARGVADHSGFRSQRRGRARRLHRTVNAMLQLSFGVERQALAAAARINRIHDGVHGHLPEAAGIFAAGTPYSAHDPDLLTWVHATLLHTNLRVYELLVAPLSAADQDRYCLEASAIEGYVGMPRGRVPRSLGELQRYMDGMLASGEISVTDTARTLAYAIVHPRVFPLVAPAFSFIRLMTAGLLPPSLRADYGFTWSERHQTRLRRSTTFLRALLALTPSIVRHWPAARRRGRPVRGHGCPFHSLADGRS